MTNNTTHCRVFSCICIYFLQNAHESIRAKRDLDPELSSSANTKDLDQMRSLFRARRDVGPKSPVSRAKREVDDSDQGSGNGEHENATATAQGSEESRVIVVPPVFGGNGVVYTRWGRDVCPRQARLVYKGKLFYIFLSLHPLHHHPSN